MKKFSLGSIMDEKVEWHKKIWVQCSITTRLSIEKWWNYKNKVVNIVSVMKKTRETLSSSSSSSSRRWAKIKWKKKLWKGEKGDWRKLRWELSTRSILRETRKLLKKQHDDYIKLQRTPVKTIQEILCDKN